MDATGMSAPSRSAKLLRTVGYFAIFAAAWVTTNAVVASGEETLESLLLPLIAVAPVLCIVLLIHGGWRVVPATLGVTGAMIALSAGLTRLDGTYLDSRDIWPLICCGASIGLPSGAYFLPRSVGHGRVWRTVSQALWYSGLFTAGMMTSVLSHGIVDILVRRKWL